MVNLNKFKKWWSEQTLTQRLVLLVAFTLPFDRIPTLELFDYTVKLSTLFGTALIIYVAAMLLRRKIPLKLSWLQKVLAVWLVVGVLTFTQATDLAAALKVMVPLGFLSVLAMALSFVADQVKKEYIFMAVLLGALIACIFGIYQFIGNYLGLPSSLTGLRDVYSWERFGFPRMQSVSLEPLYFSAYLLLPIAILSNQIIKLKEFRKLKWFCLLALFIFCVALTLSRGGIVAMTFMFFVITLISYDKKLVKRYWKQIALSSVALLSCLAIGLLGLGLLGRQGQDGDLTYNKKGISQVISHLTNTRIFASKENKQNDDSVNQRQEARNQAIESAKKSPRLLLVGVGAGQYADFVKANYKNQVYEHPGNVLLEVLVQFGMVGIIVLATLLGGIITKLYQYRKKYSYLGVLSATFIAYILAVSLQSNFFSGLAITHVWFMIGISIGYLNEGTRNGKRTSNKKAARTT